MKLHQLFAIVLLTLSANAGAHAIWIESVAGATHVCFGEYDANLREKTGGSLDKVTALEVSFLDAKATDKLNFTRQADFLLLTNNDQPIKDKQAVTVQATKSKVRDSKDAKIGMVKPMQYARFAIADIEPASTLALDIQPVAKNTFRLNLNGKPLAKTAMVVTAPNQWQREFKTNDAGEVSFDRPWDGLYVIEASYVEPVKGEFEGEKYDAIRHVSTLSIKK
ncbi:MAG TPA: hypothetical protein VK967_03440 [Methylotenera sp.]|nr:hypothetical protein [Methylotenera sp.]